MDSLKEESEKKQTLNNECFEKLESQLKADKTKTDAQLEELRKLTFKVEIDSSYLEQKFKDFVNRDFQNLSNLIKSGSLGAVHSNGSLSPRSLQQIVNDEIGKKLLSKESDRENLKNEFEEKFNELIGHLKQITQSEGGKNMAGMTALGSVLKNLKNVGVSPTAKLTERIGGVEQSIQQQEQAIGRIWKILQLKQSKNESSFFKNKNSSNSKKDSNRQLNLMGLRQINTNISNIGEEGIGEMVLSPHQPSNQGSQFQYNPTQRSDELLMGTMDKRDRGSHLQRNTRMTTSNDEQDQQQQNLTQNTSDKRERKHVMTKYY